MILLDTNIILRFKNKQASGREIINQKIQGLKRQNHKLVICPQVLYEFYVVATRPLDKNGLGLDVKKALQEIEDIKSNFTLLLDKPTLYEEWEKVIDAYQISGKTAHDARLVAFMKTYNITKFYTLNTQDFQRFGNLITLI